MEFSRADVDIFVHKSFRSKSLETALARTTHMVIGAHQDDIEIMGFHGIQECYASKTNWLTGVTLTDGRGSARSGGFKGLSDNKMKSIRLKEQRKAAEIGKYLCQIQLPYTSAQLKKEFDGVVNDLEGIFLAARPKYVYIHNLCDKHSTHVAASLRCLTALKRITQEKISDWTPEKVFGCEVWRDLDWLRDSEKVIHPVSKFPALRNKLIRVFKSQVQGGKRYDLGAEGRRRGNATFFESHKVDKETHISFAMDLTPLVREHDLDPREFIRKKLDDMKTDVLATMEEFL